MELDLLATIEMTVCAALAVAVLAIGFGGNLQARIRIAAGLAGWFILVTLLAAMGLFNNQHGVGVPGLGLAVLLPIVVLSVRVLRSPLLRRRLQTIPLSTLIGVNVIRIFGATFVLLYAADRLPAPFAPLAGWGDIFIGLTAIPVAWLTYKKREAAHTTVMIWNTLGLLDLIAAVALGVTSSPGPLQLIFTTPDASLMTALPWLMIPGFLVPLLASTHLAVFYRLGRTREFVCYRKQTIIHES
ncbi:MAG: hypothetical protein HY080_16335 [Gammaproteobacteria bacterium]|nr:hypothetical protein [Gammaproteobacteria bacterium]